MLSLTCSSFKKTFISVELLKFEMAIKLIEFIWLELHITSPSVIGDSPREGPDRWDCRGCPSRFFSSSRPLVNPCSPNSAVSQSPVYVVSVGNISVFDSSCAWVCVSAPFCKPASCVLTWVLSKLQSDTRFVFMSAGLPGGWKIWTL